MGKDKPKIRYSLPSSSVGTDVNLKDFKLPHFEDVTHVGYLLRDVRLFLVAKYGDKYPRAFTQRAISEFLGYSTPQYIHIIETGKSQPSAEYCVKLCEYYAIPVEYMYELFIDIKVRKYRQFFFKKMGSSDR